MRRTTIMASDDLLAELGRIARAEHVSLAQVVREGLQMRVDRAKRQPSFIGSGRSTTASKSLAKESADIAFEPDSWR